MKVYVIQDSDFEALITALDRNPQYGQHGGSSVVLTPVEWEAHVEAHLFFNYQIRTWIEAMKRGDRG